MTEEPNARPAGRKPRVGLDWQRVAEDYQAGIMPVARIAANHGVDARELHRRLKAMGVPPRGPSRGARTALDGRAARRLSRLAERVRRLLERRIAAGDETAFGGRDDPVALLLKLTQVSERIADLNRRAEPSEPGERPLAADDRAILERYVAWRLREHGIDPGVAGVPPPLLEPDSA